MTVPLHMKCGECGFELSIPEGIGESDLVCPACRSSLTTQSLNPKYRAYANTDDFHRDHRRTHVVLIVLAALGFLGVCLVQNFYWQSKLALLALGLVIVLSFFTQHAWAQTTRRVILILFAIAGICFLIALAVLVFLFVTCLIRGGRGFV